MRNRPKLETTEGSVQEILEDGLKCNVLSVLINYPTIDAAWNYDNR